MPNTTVPASVERFARLLMTRPVAYGGAIALAAGIGLGAWLQPPAPHYGSTGTTVVTPPQSSNVWGEDAASVSPPSYGQPVTDPADVQTAAVSPPAAGGPSNWPDAPPRVQPAVQTTTTSADTGVDAADQPPQQDALAQKRLQPTAYNARPQPPRAEYRDWAAQDASDRGEEDTPDAPPPPRWDRPAPPRWQGPPPQARWDPPRDPRWSGPPQRRWDFRPDGSAVPVGDEDDGD